MEIFAVFIVVRRGKMVCATTRDNGGIGLPGGKVDKGETPKQAALREAAEEGWKCHKRLTLVHTATVDGKTVQWFASGSARKLRNYKEKQRGIRPVVLSVKTIASVFGNSFLLD